MIDRSLLFRGVKQRVAWKNRRRHIRVYRFGSRALSSSTFPTFLLYAWPNEYRFYSVDHGNDHGPPTFIVIVIRLLPFLGTWTLCEWFSGNESARWTRNVIKTNVPYTAMKHVSIVILCNATPATSSLSLPITSSYSHYVRRVPPIRSLVRSLVILDAHLGRQ